MSARASSSSRTRSYREITRVRAAGTEQADQHDFVITPRGTALFWVYDPVPYDLTPLGGPADGVLHDGVIQEIDIATGRQRLRVAGARPHRPGRVVRAAAAGRLGAPAVRLLPRRTRSGLDADGHLHRLGPAHLGLLQDQQAVPAR